MVLLKQPFPRPPIMSPLLKPLLLMHLWKLSPRLPRRLLLLSLSLPLHPLPLRPSPRKYSWFFLFFLHRPTYVEGRKGPIVAPVGGVAFVLLPALVLSPVLVASNKAHIEFQELFFEFGTPLLSLRYTILYRLARLFPHS